MSNPQTGTLEALQKLIEVVAQLRSPEGGCPWDLQQTPESLIPYIIEEAYETVEAIRTGDKKAITEELGDLLLQVVLQAQIFSEYGDFTLQEIATAIAEKLIRRHPHVFGDVTVNNIEEVRLNWEQIKATEKGESALPPLSAKFSRYARTFPPLMAGLKISEKAAAVGFEWDNIEGVWAKVHEELEEFRYAVEHETQEQQQSELGDILFALIQLGRWHNIDPSAALQDTNQKFIQRFSQVEMFADRPLTDYSVEELDELWGKAKKIIAKQKQMKKNNHDKL